MKIVIEVKHLAKSYGSLQAVKDVSFDVVEGEIFGMLGPNGAGKTTTVECLQGLRHYDGGTARVLTGEIHAHNTFDVPDAIVPVPMDVNVGGNAMPILLPPASVVAVQMQLA